MPLQDPQGEGGALGGDDPRAARPRRRQRAGTRPPPQRPAPPPPQRPRLIHGQGFSTSACFVSLNSTS
jgi:hypothetical protein